MGYTDGCGPDDRSFQCVVHLNAGDVVSIGITSSTNSDILTVNYANFNLQRIAP